MTRTHGWRRVLTSTVVAVALLATTPGAASAAEPPPTWRDALGAMVDTAPGVTSAERRVVASTALDAVDGVADALVADLRDDAARYADETRFAGPQAAGELLDGDRRLAVVLQAALNDGTAAEGAIVDALADVLAADVQSARTSLVDARLVAADAQDRAKVAQAERQLDQALGQWGAGQPVAVVAHLEQSVRSSGAVLADAGLLPLDRLRDLDADGLPDLFELRGGSSPLVADTDGDGLTDRFEALEGGLQHRPTTADSDADGVRDDASDVDSDGLTALDEQRLGTDPLTADTDGDGVTDAVEQDGSSDAALTDTDGDGLSDASERRTGGTLDPRDADTDDDGTGDADEVVDVTTTSGGVRVTLTGRADLADGFSATPVRGGPAAAPGGGRVGTPFELGLAPGAMAGLEQAVVELPFDPAAAGDDDLRVFVHDPTSGTWLPVPGEQPVDQNRGTVTATLEHFSVYAVFSVPGWGSTLTGLGGTCRPGGGTGASVFVDVAFVLDASGSMLSNDPQRLRQQASKNFVDALVDGDKGAVVSFASGSSLLQGLTGDKAALRAAIDRVGASGGTNIGAGVSTGLSALAAETDPTVAKIMILLTDGVGSYSSSLTARAAEERVTVYTVGLGSFVDSALLQRIADETGGAYYPVATAEDLPDVFREIEEDTGDDGRDSDGDGLSDCDEELGALDPESGERLTSDPRLPDTDGDGLPDGTEIARRDMTDLERLLLAPLGPDVVSSVLGVRSDPRAVDSDGDGLDDLTELDQGSLPRDPDSDFDDLDDGREDAEGTDPMSRDSDGDGFLDAFEVANRDQGYDALVVTEIQSGWSYLGDFLVGATCGDLFGFCESDSIAWLAGNLVSGFVVYGDVRDAISSLIRLDLIGVGFAAGGVIPIAGDAVKAGEGVVKFLRRVGADTPRGRATIDFAMGLDLPASVKVDILEEAAGGLATVRRSGVADADLVRLAKRTDMKQLESLASRATRVDSGSGYFAKGSDAEIELRRITGSQADEQPFPVDPTRPGDMTGGRKVDAWDPLTRTAYESKSGYVIEARVEETLEQIAKDRALLDSGEFADVEWHFFASQAGTVGADVRILDALDDAGIPYVLHLP
ncbi:VWA domain-containing protein [Aquipuribacter nitratireducens]|uniref:VWA domain-containing protein n=1 Tax=Aquipuribacter nitratireducens TaxID=650104 RepID=A0ABW0GNT8_9MICO